MRHTETHSLHWIQLEQANYICVCQKTEHEINLTLIRSSLRLCSLFLSWILASANLRRRSNFAIWSSVRARVNSSLSFLSANVQLKTFFVIKTIINFNPWIFTFTFMPPPPFIKKKRLFIIFWYTHIYILVSELSWDSLSVIWRILEN